MTTASTRASEVDGAAATHRPLRADAARNRARILAAAEEVFAADGLAVPIDRVAERAGVGVGTLYRHFPTKEALFEAIAVSRLDTLLARCEQAGEGGEPGAAFYGFLTTLVEHASRKHDLFDALHAAGVDVKARCQPQVGELEQALDRLRLRAVAAGAVRQDVTTEQVLALVFSVCRGPDGRFGDLQACRRMLDVVFDGLRAQPDQRGA